MTREAPNGIAVLYGVAMFLYFEYIRHVEMSPDAYETHVWIFVTLLFFGALAWVIAIGARLRS